MDRVFQFVIGLFVLICLFSCSDIYAQSNAIPGSSYIGRPVKKNVLFETRLAPVYELYHSVSAELDSQSNPAESSFGINLSFIPDVMFQMLNARSRPIRTPSYMPKMVIQSDWKNPFFTLSPYIVIAHYSNGQDGETLIEKADSSASPEQPVINTYDGTFASNYIEAGYWISLDAKSRHRAGVSFEFHPSKGWFSADPTLIHRYGRKRVHYQYQYVYPNFRVEARYTRFLDRSLAGNTIININAKCRLPRMKGLAWLFADYYHGQHYYNIHFAEKLRHQIRAGLSIDARVVNYKNLKLD